MKKNLGQNFLTGGKAVTYIKSHLEKLSANYDTIFEIGPGKGYITKYLPLFFKNIFVFEKDDTFIDNLSKHLTNENIILNDILDVNLDKFVYENKLEKQNILIFGNIPYYITSPLLKKFFVENNFDKGFFMVQKEYGEKIKYNASKKSYMWWLLNYYYKVEYKKNIKANNFSPSPKVDSCLIELSKNSTYPDFDFDKMCVFLDLIGGYKRKTLSKIFKILSKKYGVYENKLYYNDNVFYFPEKLLNKRIEEINFFDMGNILNC